MKSRADPCFMGPGVYVIRGPSLRKRTKALLWETLQKPTYRPPSPIRGRKGAELWGSPELEFQGDPGTGEPTPPSTCSATTAVTTLQPPEKVCASPKQIRSSVLAIFSVFKGLMIHNTCVDTPVWDP